MKTTRRFIIILSGALLAFFLAALAWIANFDPEAQLLYVFVAQLIALSAAALSVVVFSALTSSRKAQSSADEEITRIVLLSEFNVPKEEFPLTDRTSVLIGKRDAVYFRSEIDLAVDGYAVVNRVDNAWYVERAFEERSVGLKRAGEQFVYRLKTGMSYRLHLNDIIYIGSERLLVL